MSFTVDLDDLDAIERLDSEGVLAAVESFGAQCRQGWERGLATADLPDARGIDSVVVLGMGGSGISGDAVRAVIGERLPVPLEVLKSYGPLPPWVTRNTLVFAVSYSGETEETIGAFEEAIGRGTRSVAISSGGMLADMALEQGIVHVAIPSGMQPRASLGYLTLPIFGVLARMGLVPDMQDDVDEAVEVLSEIGELCHRTRQSQDNPAKDLAARMVGRVPVVYGGHGLTATAAYRFKCDLNEYAKTPAFHAVLPELDHNEIAGWKHLKELTSSSFVLILLRDVHEDPRIASRFDLTRKLIDDKVAEVVELNARGDFPLARILSLILVTQLAAIYLAVALGVDPGPVEVIQRLKSELTKT